jgi:hypothetical protein
MPWWILSRTTGVPCDGQEVVYLDLGKDKNKSADKKFTLKKTAYSEEKATGDISRPLPLTFTDSSAVPQNCNPAVRSHGTVKHA